MDSEEKDQFAKGYYKNLILIELEAASLRELKYITALVKNKVW